MQLTDEQERVAMKSPGHLKAWLKSTGRRWVILNAFDLVDALWANGGVGLLADVLSRYTDHRREVDSGETTTITDPLGNEVEVPLPKRDILTQSEIEEAMRFLAAEAQRNDPSWTLDRL